MYPFEAESNTYRRLRAIEDEMWERVWAELGDRTEAVRVAERARAAVDASMKRLSKIADAVTNAS